MPQHDIGQPCESSIYNVCQVEYLPVTVAQLHKATRHDPVLCKVLSYTKYGWPSIFSFSKAAILEELKPFWSRTLKLITAGDCFLWGTRVISLRNCMQ